MSAYMQTFGQNLKLHFPTKFTEKQSLNPTHKCSPHFIKRDDGLPAPSKVAPFNKNEDSGQGSRIQIAWCEGCRVFVSKS